MEYKYKRETVLTEYFELETETAEAALNAVETNSARPVVIEKRVFITVVNIKQPGEASVPAFIAKLFSSQNPMYSDD